MSAVVQVARQVAPACPVRVYAFDVSLGGAFRVKARSLQEAKSILREKLDCADSNLGAWDDGSPILAQISLTEILCEVDEKPLCRTCNLLITDGEEYDGECYDCGNQRLQAQAARPVASGQRRAEFVLGHLTFALIAHSGAVGFQLIPHQAATPSARHALFDGIADADLAPTLRQIADVLDNWLRETAT